MYLNVTTTESILYIEYTNTRSTASHLGLGRAFASAALARRRCAYSEPCRAMPRHVERTRGGWRLFSVGDAEEGVQIGVGVLGVCVRCGSCQRSVHDSGVDGGMATHIRWKMTWAGRVPVSLPTRPLPAGSATPCAATLFAWPVASRATISRAGCRGRRRRRWPGRPIGGPAVIPSVSVAAWTGRTEGAARFLEGSGSSNGAVDVR